MRHMSDAQKATEELIQQQLPTIRRSLGDRKALAEHFDRQIKKLEHERKIAKGAILDDIKRTTPRKREGK